MATLEVMYPAQANTPETSLAEDISDRVVTITVLNGDALPDAPNLLTIGADGSTAETVLMTAKNGNTLTVTRGYDGTTATSWKSGAVVGRYFTAHDQNTIQKNILAVNEEVMGKAPAAVVLTGTLLADAWADGSQDVSFEGLQNSTAGIISCPASAPSEALNAAKLAELSVASQATGSVTVKASGVVPSVDIPVAVTVWGQGGTNMAIISAFPAGSDSAELAALKARVSTLLEELTANPDYAATAEVIDIRTGHDGTVYATAGDAVRALGEQIENLQNDIDTMRSTKFDDAEEIDGYLYFYANGKVVKGPLGPFAGDGTGTGGSNVGSTIKLTSGLDSRIFSIMDSAETCVLPYNWTSTDTEDGSPTGNGTATWTVNGSRVAIQKVSQGDNSFDIRPYLSTGADNTILLTVSDAYGNSKSLPFTVTVTSYGLSWNLDEMANHGVDALNLRLTPTGSGEKTVKVSVDGEEVYSSTITTTGRTLTAVIPAQAHGAHTILAWLEATVDGETLKTEPLRHVGSWIADGNTTPIVAVYNPELTIGQYGTAAIKYMVIDPSGETAAVELKSGDTTITVLTVDRTVQTWAYKAATVGTENLSIVCGATSTPVVLTVSSLGYDIAPITSGLVLDIDPSGHSNAEAGRANFGYTDAEGVNHPFTFSENFDWNGGGFQLDEDGVTAFVVKRGCYVMADRSLFTDNPKPTGKEIKLIFKSANVRNYDAELLNCVSGNVGLKLQAQQATVSSELETMTVPYCEGKKIEMDINIEAESENRLAMICLKSIPSCPPVQYGATDSWTQTAPSLLKIGSEDCDVWIYRVKMYGNSLNRYEVLDNYIADCADTVEMVARYERNDIYNDDGSISLTKLATKNPKVRVVHIWANKMTTGKKDEVVADIEIVYEAGGEEHHLIAYGVVFKAQGTSSLEYILAALNLDVDFSKATSWVDGNGNPIKFYAFTGNSIPVNYINFKANVASSESSNNVCLADDYNTFNPYICDAKAADPRVRDCIEGHPCVVFFTNTANSSIEVGARTVASGETILYFAGDMNNSKKNIDVFGHYNGNYPNQCCIEVLNNTNLQCRFRSDDLSAEAWDGDGNFEFRYPDNPTDAMKAAFQEMLSWVVSTTRDLAPGTALATPVIIDGVSYANDTEEYRAAKFLAELDNYFVRSNLLFHYLFTERHCMVDNRAKNTFLTYEYVESAGGYRWSFRCNYDNDTAEGCDNSGGATFGYGIEDTDVVGSTYAFNAHDSTIWVNIRDLMFGELTEMYVSLKGNGAWSASRYTQKANDYQAATPEAIRTEDAWNKYIYPLLLKGESAYKEKCYGPKEEWREQFETYEEIYMNSKYCDVTDRSNAITMRATTERAADGNIDITPYSDMYIVVMYGNGGTVRIRAKRNTTYTSECPADSLTDTEAYIFSASHLSKLGSLASLKPKLVIATAAGKLLELPVGSGEAGYENLNMTSISLGNNTMLEYLDVRGLPNLVQLLDLSNLTSLEEFYGNNSGITGIIFAKGAPLRIARIPAVTSLTALDLSKLETFVMDASKLLSLRVENSPAIDTLSLCKAATGLIRGRLTDVDWTDDNADTIMRLAKLQTAGGLDAEGNTIDGFVLTGKAYCSVITQGEIDTITATFPNLALSYGEIVTSYQVSFQNTDGTVMKLKDGTDAVFTVRHGGSVTNPVTAGLMDTPTKESTIEENFAFTGWNVSLTNIITDTVVTPVFGASTRYYIVRHWYDDAESSLLQTDTVAAHGSVSYNGNALTKSDGSLWMGWDAPTTDVVSDMDVHAAFITPKLPDAVATDYDFLYSDNPADNSGYTLAEFCGIIKAGREQEYFSIKDKIKVTPNTDVFADTEIHCVVSDFNHSRLADGSDKLARVEWDMLGIMNSTRGMNSTNTNVGGWDAAAMRTFLNEKVYPAMPLWFRTLVPKVKVRSSKGGTSAEIVVSEDYLYLRSHAEVGFDTTAVPYVNEVDPEAEHVALPIYTDNASRIKKTYNGTGSAAYWWLRSPDPTSSASFRYVNYNGIASSYIASGAHGVSFGFVTNL